MTGLLVESNGKTLAQTQGLFKVRVWLRSRVVRQACAERSRSAHHERKAIIRSS